MRQPLLSLALILGGVAIAPQGARAAEVTVFAAASLSDALVAIARRYEPASGDRIRFNFGASSMLARQIREGAPADVFFSADEAKMNDLAKEGMIDPATRATLLSNTLVIVTRIDADISIARPLDLLQASVRRLAIAEPDTVPAGIYARVYLQKIGLWKQLASKLLPAENVRSALAAVVAGNADAGIVYKTDSLISKEVRVACEVPAWEEPRISYPIAILSSSRHPAAAAAWVNHLSSPEARAVFSRFGFLSPSRRQ